MKKLIRLLVVVLAAFLLVKLCTNMGGMISLPGSTGSGSDTGSSGDSGGWFSPKEKSDGQKVDKTVKDIAEEIEKELGIGKSGKSSSGTNSTSSSTTSSSTNSSPTDSSNPLTFKGIPIKGTLSEFGAQLTKAGFRNAGSGVYTGDFAGYGGCKVTPSGTNPVSQVRVDFPVITDWDSLEKAYDDLQASLTQKYGQEPVTSPNSNVATYNLPNGTITLDADVKQQSSWHVILTYANNVSLLPSPTTGTNPIDDL